MEFSIVIDYNIKEIDDKELDEEIQFEYYKRVYREGNEKKERVYHDVVKFFKKKILIEGKRTAIIDLDNCWKTKKSNYKRCILSSLFYAYNFYGQPIEIKSIIIRDNFKNEVYIPFEQEFNSALPSDYAINLSIIEYLFKSITYKEASDVVYRVLHSQALYTKGNDFYDAYRSFNAMYTFIYKYHNELAHKGEKNSDLPAIISILRMNNIEKILKKSIDLSENFVSGYTEELYRLVLKWLMDEKVSNKDEVATIVCFPEFKYKNIKVLEIINEIIEKNYPNSSTTDKRKPLKGFDSNYKKKKKEDRKNYLQLLTLYARYRRNKLLHGEHVDHRFLISDVNADILLDISKIIFQFSIDLVNNIEESDFSKAKIF